MGVIDMTGQKCGRLTVIKRAENNASGQAMWECLCECGNTVVVQGTKLRNGHTKSCGCLKKDKGAEFLRQYNQNHTPVNFIDITDKKYGLLTVLKRDSEFHDDTKAYWICRCECGKETVVRGTDLRLGKVKSCGCLRYINKLNDLTGQKFGKLTVLKQDENKHGQGAYWICQCECGKICSIKGSKLTSDGVKSCGCEVSKGEYKLTKILNELNIEYIQQKTFENLKGKKLPLRFDFYLPSYNTCIEYQGLYHYEPRQRTQEEFKQQQEYDELKRQYCKNYNIKLIEIPYWDFDELNENYLMKRIKEEI